MCLALLPSPEITMGGAIGVLSDPPTKVLHHSEQVVTTGRIVLNFFVDGEKVPPILPRDVAPVLRQYEVSETILPRSSSVAVAVCGRPRAGEGLIDPDHRHAFPRAHGGEGRLLLGRKGLVVDELRRPRRLAKVVRLVPLS